MKTAAAQEFEIACPHCGEKFTAPGFGRFICPHCSNPVEIGNSEAIGKTRVDNGLGWWTIISLVAWLLFLLPGVLFLSAVIFNLFVAHQSQQNMAGGEGIGLVMAAVGIVILTIGLAMRSWAMSGKFSIVCGKCGNKTTKAAMICATCGADFSS
jgi:hypothetical protein